ncbi:hypothetical protein ACSHT2_05375 [Bradyrhizobium sp. PUT101]|uniref:hypothetical protein n=1 Tax=Bradyrhizobium sp. PUT101 TaxID=3447427 RepID=UPI003F86B81A
MMINRRLPLCPAEAAVHEFTSLRQKHVANARSTIGAVARKTAARPDLKPYQGPDSSNIPLYRNSVLSYTQNTLARDKGRIAIVTNRGPGSDGRDGVGRNRHCRAASAVSNLPSRIRHGADSVFAWLRA